MEESLLLSTCLRSFGSDGCLVHCARLFGSAEKMLRGLFSSFELDLLLGSAGNGWEPGKPRQLRRLP